MTDVKQDALNNAKELSTQGQDITSGCCLMGFSIQSSCGEVTLPDAKIEIDGQVVSNNHVKGSKLEWFPRNKLSITSKYTARLSRTFNQYGVKFGEFTVVPIDRVKELQEILGKVHSEWQDDVSLLMKDFDTLLDKHCEKNPDIAALIRRFALKKEVFESRFNLNYIKPLAIKPLFEEDKAALQAQVSESLWENIAKDASQLYKTSWFKDKKPVSQVSQGIRNPLKRISEKLLSLSFIDESVLEVTKTIQEVFNKLPSAGYIKGHDFDQLTNWVHVLSSEEKLRMHAEGSAKFEYQTKPEPIVAQSVTPQSAPLGNSLLEPNPSPVDSNTVVEQSISTSKLAPEQPMQIGLGLGW